MMIASDRQVTCVYNTAHQIYESRLQYHLVKCKKVHNDQKKAICSFDSTHHVPASDYLVHIQTCPNRRVLDEHAYHVDGERRSAEECWKEYVPVNLPPPQESWDTDGPGYTYNPDRVSREKPVIRVMTGGTKSERKAFRQRECRRLQNLNNGLPLNERQSA
ncbi:gametocyte-specific factor 1 homolog [Schistocerca gregaria]|uniref:gametocyte-specific factor 1 homolog n=1 Tax=Schistocerca gregaria TaxID=7010 RepID=UPI00211F247D|nr:gametocyte-specific factor 1 homolog [Schistocerca gregaria]